MQNRFYLLLLFTFISVLVYGQRQFLINPKAGLGITQFREAPEGFSSKADFGFQAGLDLRMGKRFFWQPGLFYSANTVVLVDSSQFSLSDNSVVSTYVKFKLIGGIHLVNKEGFRLRLNAGPSVSRLLSVEAENENTALIENDDFKSMLLNFEAGGGVDIWFLTFDVGYNLSFTNLINITSSSSRLVGAYMYAGIVIPL
jgi:hypothetical protein